MKRIIIRLALSLLGGFLLPLLYLIIVGPLTNRTGNRTLNFFASVPVRWPILLLYRLDVLPSTNELWLMLYIVGANVVFYGSLIYFVLLALSRRKPALISQPAAESRIVDDDRL